MKKLVYILLLTLLCSCSQKEYTIAVTYTDGEKDTISTIAGGSNYFFLEKGDLKITQGTARTLRSGVREFKVLKIKKLE